MTPFKKILSSEKEKIKSISIPNLINKNFAKTFYTYTIDSYKTKSGLYSKVYR